MTRSDTRLDISGCTPVTVALVKVNPDAVVDRIVAFLPGEKSLEDAVKKALLEVLENEWEFGDAVAGSANAETYVQLAIMGWDLYVMGDVYDDARYIAEANADMFEKPIDWDARPRRNLGGAVRNPRTPGNRRQGTDAMKARSKATKPKAKAPAKKPSKPKSKGVRR